WLVAVEGRQLWASELMGLDPVDDAGAPVCTTWQGGVYRGGAVAGPGRPAVDVPAPPEPLGSASQVHTEVSVPISALAAHVYTECARIWNPVHTDTAVAARAGLPGLILHGTATLALAVSQILRIEAGDEPRR